MKKTQENLENGEDRKVAGGATGGCIKIFFAFVIFVEVGIALASFGKAIYLITEGAASDEVWKSIIEGGIYLLLAGIVVCIIWCDNPALWCVLLIVYGVATVAYVVGVPFMLITGEHNYKFWEILLMAGKGVFNLMVTLVAFYLVCCGYERAKGKGEE